MYHRRAHSVCPPLESERTVAIGFVVAVGLLLLVLSVVGFQETLATIAAANRESLALILVAVALWDSAWSRTLSLVLSVLDVEHGPLETVLPFGEILFVNSVAPSTYPRGEPLAAFLLARHTGSDYETTFATVSTVDLLNYVPMLPLAGIGFLYVATTAALGRRIELVLAAVVILFETVFRSIGYGRRYRRPVLTVAAGTVGRVSRVISSVVPGVRAVSPVTLYRRLELFVSEVERVSADQRAVGRALGYSTAGSVSRWYSGSRRTPLATPFRRKSPCSSFRWVR